MTKRRKNNPQVEQRSLENPSVPLSAAYDYLALSSRQAGVSVNRVSVHQIPALRRAVQIKGDRLAKCGVDVYKNMAYGPVVDVDHAAHWLLWRKPALGFTPFTFIKQISTELDIFGNSFWGIKWDTKYNPTTLVHFDPEYTGIILEEGELYYITQINNVQHKLPAEDVLHFKNLTDSTGLLGISPLCYCQQVLGLSLAILKYETFQFQNQCRPSVIVSLPPNLASDPVKKANFRKTFEQIQTGIESAGRVAMAEPGTTFTVLDTSNQSNQLIQLNEKQERAICQLIGIDPSCIGLDVATSHNSLEQKEDTLLENLDGPMTNIEQEFEDKLLKFSQLNNDTHVILFNRNDFKRTDLKTQNEIDLAQLAAGAKSWEEVRIKNNMPTDKKATELWFHQSNVVPFDITDPIPKPPEPAPIAPEPKAEETPAEDKTEPAEEPKTNARDIASRLLEKTADRIVNRLRKSIESRSVTTPLTEIADGLRDDHEAVIHDSLDVLPNYQTITDTIIDDLAEELRSISKEDIDKINWTRFQGIINANN